MTYDPSGSCSPLCKSLSFLKVTNYPFTKKLLLIGELSHSPPTCNSFLGVVCLGKLHDEAAVSHELGECFFLLESGEFISDFA